MRMLALCAASFVIGASLFNWSGFFENPKAVFFVNLFGRDGARAIHSALGIVLIVVSFFFDVDVGIGVDGDSVAV